MMKIDFTGVVHQTESCKGIWLNTIDLEDSTGKRYVVDRDVTEFDIMPDGTFSMTWRNCYVWENGECNVEKAARLAESGEVFKLADIEVEEDADDGYDIKIDEFVVNVQQQYYKEKNYD